MSKKSVGIPSIGFDEALQRIAKFHKGNLPCEKKLESKNVGKANTARKKPTKEVK